MINVFTLTNINTKIIQGKLSKNFISEVYIKLVALRIDRYTRSSSQFQKRLVTPGLLDQNKVINVVLHELFCVLSQCVWNKTLTHWTCPKLSASWFVQWSRGGAHLKCRMLKKTFVVGVDEPLDLVKLTLSKQTGKQGWKNIFLVLIVLAKEN